MEWIMEVDRQLFGFINGSLSNSVFDILLPPLRNKTNWFAVYVLAAGFLVWKFRMQGVLFIGLAALTVVLTDQLSASLMKPMFERLRPCNDPNINYSMNLLVHCGGGFSFVSSHAANHFGLACFAGLNFRHSKWVLPILLLWAGTISIAQVYVGVHYPADITVGGLLGLVCALLTVWIFKMSSKKIKGSL